MMKKLYFTCTNLNIITSKKKQAVLLMITDGEKWHYTVLKSEQTEDGFIRPTKSLSRLFKGITSNHMGDFFSLNFFPIHLEATIFLKNVRNYVKIMIIFT